MADFPTTGITPLFINSMSRWANVTESQTAAAPTTANTWPTANRAIYVPFSIPWPYPVRRVFWSNGSSVTSTNWDMGIYTADGTRIYSTTSTAASGVSVLQYVTPTEFVLTPGRYYMALACSSATAARGGTGATGAIPARLAMAGYLQEAAALPLPATADLAATCTFTIHPLFGITKTASGF